MCAAYEDDYLHTHPDDLAALRHAIQPLMADLAAKLTPTPPSIVRGALLHYRAYYAGLWNEKPEQTLALYREILKGGEVDGAWAREQLFQATPPRQPFLDLPDGVPQPEAPSWIRMAAPWIVAWDGRTPEQMRQLWQAFVRQLAASPDLLEQCDAMKFEVCSDQTEAAPRRGRRTLCRFSATASRDSQRTAEEGILRGHAGAARRAGPKGRREPEALRWCSSLPT
ncbi:MAG: hypothetical protein WDO13_00695 [Verrucomicrobiota bacterium]